MQDQPQNNGSHHERNKQKYIFAL